MGDDGVAENAVDNPRLDFLKSIGLANDPFATPVAEQELKIEEIPPRFYAYFTSPAFASLPQDQDIFQVLRSANHAFIYGAPGSGKTTLRLMLESDCRTRLDHTLVVTYNLGEDIAQPLSSEQHWKRLARTFAIDLFIQIVEQFDPSPETTPEQTSTLRQIMYLSECHLRRVVDRILENPLPNSLAGLGAYWSLANRPVVRYVSSSKRLLDLLQSAKPVFPCPPPPDEIQLVHTGWDIAKQWGFKRAIVLVDGVDARKRTVDWMMILIEPLVQFLEHWSEREIFFKFFLTTELEKPLQDYLAKLHLKYIRDRITWDKDSLRNLLRERFRVAGSRKVGFSDVAGKGLENKLDDLILDSAEGSPRRMLQIISALIDAHIARAPQEDKFTILDWETMRRDWAFDPPSPQAA